MKIFTWSICIVFGLVFSIVSIQSYEQSKTVHWEVDQIKYYSDLQNIHPIHTWHTIIGADARQEDDSFAKVQISANKIHYVYDLGIGDSQWAKVIVYRNKNYSAQIPCSEEWSIEAEVHMFPHQSKIGGCQ